MEKETWLITGCSRGIGRGIAEYALQSGKRVVMTARDAESLRELSEAYPEQALALALDVTQDAMIEEAVRTAEKKFGGIDVLVNNAGYAYRVALEEGEWSEIERIYATNLFGPLKLMRAVLPGMRAARRGAVVKISSISAVQGAVGSGYYASAKAAIEQLSVCLRREAAPLGIKVMIVEPGPFRTGFQQALTDGAVKIADYAETAWKTRRENLVLTHDEAGDPKRAGKIIVDTIERPDYPERLVLGKMAVEFIRDRLRERLDEIAAWQEVSAAADYPAHEA